MSELKVPLCPEPTSSNSLSELAERSPRTPRKTRKPRVPLPKQPPVAIRSLWEWATPAEKERAHLMAAALMEYWLGQSTKQEIAIRLELPMLRVWQLSQQALAGMVVGLLHPPKDRMSAGVRPEDNPKKLKQRIEALEKQVSTQQRLIVILREMPASREALLIREKLVLESQQESMRATAEAATEKNAKPARKARELRKS